MLTASGEKLGAGKALERGYHALLNLKRLVLFPGHTWPQNEVKSYNTVIMTTRQLRYEEISSVDYGPKVPPLKHMVSIVSNPAGIHW